MLTRNAESGHLYFVPELKGKVFSLHPNNDVSFRFLVDVFYQIEVVSSRVLISTGYWIFKKSFSTFIEMVILCMCV